MALARLRPAHAGPCHSASTSSRARCRISAPVACWPRGTGEHAHIRAHCGVLPSSAPGTSQRRTQRLQWHLTPPSSGRPRASFAVSRSPLMSNVRSHQREALAVVPCCKQLSAGLKVPAPSSARSPATSARRAVPRGEHGISRASQRLGTPLRPGRAAPRSSRAVRAHCGVLPSSAPGTSQRRTRGLQWHLTTPSSGRPRASYAVSRSPLMSNVRPH